MKSGVRCFYCPVPAGRYHEHLAVYSTHLAVQERPPPPIPVVNCSFFLKMGSPSFFLILYLHQSCHWPVEPYQSLVSDPTPLFGRYNVIVSSIIQGEAAIQVN